MCQRTCEPYIAKNLAILTYIADSERYYAASLGHGGQASSTYGRQCIDPASLQLAVGANSHVFSDGGIADSVGCSGQASFATVAGATAVETGHVNAVQVIVHTAPWGTRLVLSVFLIRPSIGQGKGRAREGMMERWGKW